MKTLYFKLIALSFVVCTTNLVSQDIHFSQIQESPLWLNPANTGLFNGYARAIVNYRNQWVSSGSPFKTMALSADGVAYKKSRKKAYLGVGLFVFNDQAGTAKLGLTQAQLNVNAIVMASKKSKIAGGLYAGFSQNKANLNVLTYGTQFNGKEIDASLPSDEKLSNVSFGYLDVGAGINYEFSNVANGLNRDDIITFKIGGAVHHLNKPSQYYYANSTSKLPMRFVGNAQARIDFKGTKFTLLPSIIYLRQASSSEITLGTHFRYRFKNGTKFTGNSTEQGINIGVYYRVNDAIIPQLNVDLGKYAIGFSYDINMSKYRQASKANGGFELYLKYMILGDALRKRQREF